MKYPREKILDPQNTYEKKFGTHVIPTRKNFGPTEYPREKTLDQQNTHENENWKPRNAHEKKLRTHEIHTRKTVGPRKLQREKILDPRNTHKKIFWTQKKEIWTHKDMMAQWHETRYGTRLTEFSTLNF